MNGYVLAILFVADSCLGIWALLCVVYLEWRRSTPEYPSPAQLRSLQFQEVSWTLVGVASFVGMFFILRSIWKLFTQEDRGARD